jgi:hypothetical protein
MSCKRRKQEQNQTVLNTVKPASWHQAQETWMKDATCCSSTHSLQKAKRNIPWAQNWGHKFGSWATNFNIVAPFWGPESGPCFGATKHKQESIRAASVLLPPQADSSTYPWYWICNIDLYIYKYIYIYYILHNIYITLSIAKTWTCPWTPKKQGNDGYACTTAGPKKKRFVWETQTYHKELIGGILVMNI